MDEQKVIAFDVYNMADTGGVSKTLNSAATDTDHIPVVCYAVENHPNDSRVRIDNNGIVQTLSSRMGTGGGNTPMVLIDVTAFDVYNFAETGDIGRTLSTSSGGLNEHIPVVAIKKDAKEEQTERKQRKYVLRRLTPTECARLQGFPDWWTNGIKGSDSNLYRMWGNGIALPCAADTIGRIVKAIEKEENNNA